MAIKRDTPLSATPDTGNRKIYGKKLTSGPSAASKVDLNAQPKVIGPGSPEVKPRYKERKIDGYLEGSGTKNSMGANIGASYRINKNLSVNASGYGGKDEGGGYYGYSVEGKLTIPIGSKKKKR